MTYKDILDLALSPWIDVRGIQKLASCGRSNAAAIRKQIEQDIIDSGKKLPIASRKYVPTRLVLDFLGLNEDYIVKMASLVK